MSENVITQFFKYTCVKYNTIRILSTGNKCMVCSNHIWYNYNHLFCGILNSCISLLQCFFLNSQLQDNFSHNTLCWKNIHYIHHLSISLFTLNLSIWYIYLQGIIFSQYTMYYYNLHSISKSSRTLLKFTVLMCL